MLIRRKNIFLLVITLFLLTTNTLKAQWKLEVKGTVKNEETKKRFEGVSIIVKKNGTYWKTIKSSPSGEFELDLLPDAVYIVEFTKAGYTTKKMEFSTKGVPEEDAKYGFDFPMIMNLFEEVEGLDVSILDKPIAKVSFNPNSGIIDYDPEYTKSIQNALDKLKREFEEKKKQQEASLKDREKEYALVISNADKMFNLKNWGEAKLLYEKAAKLLPNESYPQFQLGLISDETKAQEEKNKRYSSAIQRADAAFKERNWDKAVMEYNSASSYKSDENYPKNKIKEIDDIKSNEKKVSKEYNALIVSADAFLINKEYLKAKVDYQKASVLKDYEQYPKDKLNEVNALMAELAKKEAEEKAINDKYNALIKAADNFVLTKTYNEAKAKYNEAIKVKPSEQYPKDKLIEIDGLIAEALKKAAEEKVLNEKYQALITAADKALGLKTYAEAKSKYSEALSLKAEEKYPKEKLKEIEAVLAELAKKEAEEKAVNEKYQALIITADNAFGLKMYADAKVKYNEALSLKAEEKYPKDKLKEIEVVLAELAKKEAEEKAVNEKYQTLITTADNAFSVNTYAEAKIKYNEAVKIKPNEQYPKDKLKEIDKLMAEAAKKAAEEKVLNEKYLALITTADKALASKSYEDSKIKYNEALALKPAEQYPKDKLQDINEALAIIAKKEAEEKALNEKYQALISSADNAMLSKNYEEAITKYNSAIDLKNEEKYPKSKLKEIDTILADLAKKKAQEEASKMASKEKDEKYNQLIVTADNAFASIFYEKAKNTYNAALGIKPEEQYPKDKLKEIESILNKIANQKAEEIAALKMEKELSEKYQQLITSADKAFESKNYNQAKASYQEAISLKPLEKHPKNKLIEVEGLIKAIEDKESQNKAKNEQYNVLISQADKAFDSKLYENARIKYMDAIRVNPGEKYPKDKIDEIGKIEAEIAKNKHENELEKEAEKKKRDYYLAVIAQADADFYANNFEKSEKKYYEALVIYPSEQYPKNQLNIIKEKLTAKEIQKITVVPNALEQKKIEYDKLIVIADNELSIKKYNQAILTYQKALNLLPTEEYPNSKINEINQLLEEKNRKDSENKKNALALKAKKERYDLFIFEGDKNFMLANYKTATKNYKEALILFPNEQYPKDQLIKIEDLLQKIKENEQKDEIVVTKKPLSSGERAKIDDSRERALEEKMAQIIQRKEREKSENLSTEKKYYLIKDNKLIDQEIEETTKSQQDINSLKKNLDEYSNEDNNHYKRNEDLLKENVDVYNQIANERVKKNTSKLNANEIQNKKQNEKVAQDYLTYEEHQNNRKEDVKQYYYTINKLEELRINAAQKRVEENRQFITALSNQIKLRDEKQSANYKLSVDKIATQIELFSIQHKSRVETENKKNKTSTDQLSIYKNQLQSNQETLSKNATNKIEAQNIAIANAKEKLNTTSDEQNQKRLEADKKLQNENQFYVDYNSKLIANQTERTTKANAEKNDVYVGAKNLSNNIDEFEDKLPQGITEKERETDNAIILTRYKVTGNHVDVYEKIFYKWGAIYYTKNGASISENNWNNESIER